MTHFKSIKEFDPDQSVVSMVEFKGQIYVATSFQVWRIVDDELVPLDFVVQGDGGKG